MARKTTKPTLTLAEIERRFPDDAACKALLTTLRWPDGKVTCPRCGEQKRVYKTATAFRWNCKGCNKNGYRFSVLTGTVFENTNMPLTTWFRVAFLMISSKKGISALQVHRMMPPVRGTTGSYKTAWYMCHRIRAAMKGGLFAKLEGEVEVDETYIGGSKKNRHRNKQTIQRKKLLGCKDDKTPVIGAVSRKSGRVTAKVLSRVTAKAMQDFVRASVADDVSLIATDDHQNYRTLHRDRLPHESVNHSKGEYSRQTVRGAVHTAHIDSFWSLLKRGIMGTFHQVSREYLPLYVSEFSWRYNHRDNERIFHALLAGC